MNLYGILLFDADEIIFRLYKKTSTTFELVAGQVHDLATFDSDTPVSSLDMLHVVTERIFDRYAMQRVTWMASARHVPEHTLQDVTKILKLDIPLLSLSEEQDLLCKGMLMGIV